MEKTNIHKNVLSQTLHLKGFFQESHKYYQCDLQTSFFQQGFQETKNQMNTINMFF